MLVAGRVGGVAPVGGAGIEEGVLFALGSTLSCLGLGVAHLRAANLCWVEATAPDSFGRANVLDAPTVSPLDFLGLIWNVTSK